MDNASDNKILTFVILSFSYIAKFVLYRFLVELDGGINTGEFIAAYGSCIVAAMFLSVCVCWKSGVLWSILLMIVTDLWLLANIWYFAANHMFIQWSVVLFATELRGFESSILSFVQWSHALFPLITIAITVFLLCYRKELAKASVSSKTLWSIVAIGVALLLICGISRFLSRKDIYADADTWSIREEESVFLRTHSPLGHLACVAYGSIKEGLLSFQAVLPPTEHEQAILARVCLSDQPASTPPGHMVMVLVESLETWALQAKDREGNDVTPNLNRFVQEHNVLLCKKLYSQQQYGRSGDGQLITQTGLLPLRNGIACMSYGDNTYPNYAHFYPNSVVVNSYRGVWNQRVTTYSYGYQCLREPQRHTQGTDSLVFVQTREVLESAHEPTCVLAITINTHAPFKSVRPTLDLTDDFAPAEKSYLQCVHYMDKHLGRFLAWADTASVMKNSTIVITADHNHFPITADRGTCPLIIASPAIRTTTEIKEAFQMDIFPTVIHAIEQSYYWKGLGIDLLDSTAVCSPRLVSPHEASVLSDKLIRTNWFN